MSLVGAFIGLRDYRTLSTTCVALARACGDDAVCRAVYEAQWGHWAGDAAVGTTAVHMEPHAAPAGTRRAGAASAARRSDAAANSSSATSESDTGTDTDTDSSNECDDAPAARTGFGARGDADDEGVGAGAAPVAAPAGSIVEGPAAATAAAPSSAAVPPPPLPTPSHHVSASTANGAAATPLGLSPWRRRLRIRERAHSLWLYDDIESRAGHEVHMYGADGKKKQPFACMPVATSPHSDGVAVAVFGSGQVACVWTSGPLVGRMGASTTLPGSGVVSAVCLAGAVVGPPRGGPRGATTAARSGTRDGVDTRRGVTEPLAVRGQQQQLLAAVGNTVVAVDAHSLEPVGTFTGKDHAIRGIAARGSTIIAGDTRGSLLIWDGCGKRKLAAAIPAHNSAVRTIRFLGAGAVGEATGGGSLEVGPGSGNSDGDGRASAGAGAAAAAAAAGAAPAADAAPASRRRTGPLVWARKAVGTNTRRSSSSSAGSGGAGMRVASSEGRGRLKLWDVERRKCLGWTKIVPVSHELPTMRDFEVLPDDSILHVQASGVVALFDTRAMESSRLCDTGLCESITALCPSPDGARFAVTGLAKVSAHDGLAAWRVAVYDIRAASTPVWSRVDAGHCVDLTWDPDARKVAGACADGSVRVWGAELGTVCQRIDGEELGIAIGVAMTDVGCTVTHARGIAVFDMSRCVAFEGMRASRFW